jgi:hypothetical protein
MSDQISSDDDTELPPLTEFESYASAQQMNFQFVTFTFPWTFSHRNILAMRQELAELSNSVFHLQRTNQEIREEFDSDPELAGVIVENDAVIVRHSARIDKLSKEVAHFEALQQHRGPAPTAAPAPPSVPNGAGSSNAEIFL